MTTENTSTTTSQWHGRVSQRWIDLVGANWDGELLSNDVVEELVSNVDEDPSIAYLLARLQQTREEQSNQKHHEYAVPYQWHTIHDFPEDIDAYTIEVEHCDHCGEFACDYNWCIDNAFFGKKPETLNFENAETLIEGREYDQVGSDSPDVINDTFLVLAQGLITLDDFNARVGSIYKAANPDKSFEGWSFTLTVEENAAEGFIEGVFAAEPQYADAVAIALNEIAKALDNGEYVVERY